MNYNVAIVGAGLIGNKRAAALSKFNNCHLIVTVDVNSSAAENLAKKFGGDVETDWQKVIGRTDLHIIIVSTVSKFLAPITIAALDKGKYVLSEKPLGHNAREAEKMVRTAKANNLILKTGFNHRHHPAVKRAKELFQKNVIGRLLFLRCRYGHGGRPGYEKEWRSNKKLCGGGEMLDQGVHVVDLFRWFAGDFSEGFGYTATRFWRMNVEDNAVAMFRRNDGVIAVMHTSWTQWKNLFSFEVFGDKGYLIIEGLGGSYGVETLRIGKRKVEGGKPDEEIEEFGGPDISWEEEWREFIQAIENNKEPIGNGWDGYQANKMVDAIYKSMIKGKIIKL